MNKPEQNITKRNTELCLFCLDEDINVLFNPETQSSCNILPGIKKQLLAFPASAGVYGEVVIHVPGQKITKSGDSKSLFKFLKARKFVETQTIAKTNVNKFKEEHIFPSQILILPAFGCNLHCSYCWNTYGTYGHPMKTMDYETAVQTGKWISSLITAGADKNRLRKVEFFGGEPLLAPDAFKIITKTIRKTANKKKQKITILLATNGLLLNDELIRFCRDHRVEICTSMDGPQELHDAKRVDAAGKGSHLRVVEVIKRIQKIYPNGLRARATVTPPYDFMTVYEYMHNLGLTNFSCVPITNERIGVTGSGILHKDYGAKGSRKGMFKFFNTYLDRLILRDNAYFIEDFFTLITAGLTSELKVIPCGLGIDAPCVLPDGTFVPCFKFAFDRSRSIGDVRRGMDDKAVVENMNFAASHPVWSYEPCRKCFARYKCGGPCFASAQALKKQMDSFCGITCEMKREQIIRAFYAVALLIKKDPAMFLKIQENLRNKNRKSLRQLFNEHYLHKAS